MRNGINSVTIFCSDGNFILNVNENDVIKWPILDITESELGNVAK